jgi:hypothetical protein
MSEDSSIFGYPFGDSHGDAPLAARGGFRIEALLKELSDDKPQVRISFDYREGGCIIRAVLILPTGILLARTLEPRSDHQAAIDELVSNLEAAIKTHRKQKGRRSGEGSFFRSQLDLAAGAGHLEALYRQKDREGFFDFLRPLLRRFLSAAQTDCEEHPVRLIEEMLEQSWKHWGEPSLGDGQGGASSFLI